MNSRIFCRKKLRKNRDRALYSNPKYDFLFEYSAESLVSKLEDLFVGSTKPKEHINHNSRPTILELGARHGVLSRLLSNVFPAALIITSELSLQLLQANPAKLKLVLDEEKLCFSDNSFDIILSSLNLHWINNIPDFLKQIKSILKPNGVFIASFIGGESLMSLRKNLVIAESNAELPNRPHLSPMITHSSITHLLQTIGFRDIVTDKETITVEYQGVLSLMYDLKYMGESAAFDNSHNYALGKRVLYNLQKIYTAPFEEYFEIITLTIRK